MEKKETNTLSIFQRPVWVSLFALTAAISWGWAYPLIKMGMEEYQITADMTGSKMLFAGIRFFISGIIILAIARSSHRKFGFKKKAVQENVGTFRYFLHYLHHEGKHHAELSGV